MVTFEQQNSPPPPLRAPGPPYNSNQQPIGPGNPWELFAGIPQYIKTATQHETPAVDNYQYDDLYNERKDQGVSQNITRWIPNPLPDGVYPGSYGFIIEPRTGIKQLTTVGVWPSGAKELGPTGKSYGFDLGSALGGIIVGFVAGALVLTATGKSLTKAAAQRVEYYVKPKQ
jgi:hypothetical protein